MTVLSMNLHLKVPGFKLFLAGVLLSCFFALSGACAPNAIDNLYGEYLLAEVKQAISMDLEGALLIDVLKALSKQSGLNFVATGGVEGKTLTLYFDNVPLREAMDIIFESNGLKCDFYSDANVFVVKETGKPTLELITKVYRLKHIKIASSRFQKEADNAAKSGDEGGSDSGGETADVKEVVQEILSDNGRVVEDAQTNSLIVVDIASQFPAIDRVIAQLDTPEPKVMIEVEILDVSVSALDTFGVQWPQSPLSLYVPGTRETAFPFFDNHKPDVNANFHSSTLTVIGASLALDFLKNRSDTKYLARPKLLTLANEVAEINITKDEAIGIKRTQNEDENGNVTYEYEIERAETGMRLRVTPRVDMETEDITLVVETKVIEAVDSGFTAGTDAMITGTIKDPEERRSSSLVRLKNGETLLLGGMIREDVIDTQYKVPFFSDIPFVGALFRHKYKKKDERELLVFITPRLMKDVEGVIPDSSLPKGNYREQSVRVNDDVVGSTLDSFLQR